MTIALPAHPFPSRLAGWGSYITMRSTVAYANLAVNPRRKAVVVMELQNELQLKKDLEARALVWKKIWGRVKYRGWHAALLLAAARFAQEKGFTLYVTDPQHHLKLWTERDIHPQTASQVYGWTPKNVAKVLGARIEHVDAGKELGLEIEEEAWKKEEFAMGLRHPVLTKFVFPAKHG